MEWVPVGSGFVFPHKAADEVKSGQIESRLSAQGQRRREIVRLGCATQLATDWVAALR
jgi:hypothetical protein